MKGECLYSFIHSRKEGCVCIGVGVCVEARGLSLVSSAHFSLDKVSIRPEDHNVDYPG